MAYKDHNQALEYYRQYNLKRRTRRTKETRAIAQEQELTHYSTGKPCKYGHIAVRRVKDRVCSECSRLKSIKRNIENPEKVRKLRKESYERNKDHHLAQKKVYRQANKGKIIALATARKKYVKQRTPKWLTDFDKLKIKCLYSISAMLTRENKEPWHVDHTIPLQGKLVSGLHVPSNMQIMRGVENIGKKNKFEVI